MEKYINPFTDFGFKKLFGEEANKDLLIDFLNELLTEKSHITQLTYLKNEHLGSAREDRRAIFDLYCENDKGEKFIVELQKAKQQFFKDRSLYYSTFPIQEQARTGEWDFELQSVYTVSIMDFIFEEDTSKEPKFIHDVWLIEKPTQKVFSDKLRYIYLEMPKFSKTEQELVTHFDKWLFVLKNLSGLQSIPSRLQERIFEKLFKVAEIAQYSPEDRQAYQNSLKYYRDIKNVLDTAFEEGKEEGRMEGITEGKLKGKIESARKLIAKGQDDELIAEVTGLSRDEINNLRKEHTG